MNKIVQEKWRKQLIFYSIIIITFIILGNVGAVKAAKQSPGKTTDISHRRVEFNNNIYDVYINYKEKFISVHGKADSWGEIRKVEKHFEVTAPAEYEIAYDISLAYDNYKL
ncbi:MAG: hypothetical protein ACMUIP_10920 [bacterium]